MATLISSATGNFTAAGTWKTADTTSFLDSEAGNTALTTSPVASSTFTPGAITVDGIAVKLASVAGSTGTITITLDKAGTTIATVTQNIATLPTCTTANNEGGWVLFQFAAVTLLAATAYSVKASVSAGASTVNLYRDATAGNWARLLRQSTNVGAAAPTTGDVVYVMGQLTGTAGTTSYTVTMNSTSTNQLGAVTICDYGTLAYGTAASTAYYLKTIGNQPTTPGVIVYSGGTLTMGTLATPIPSTSSAVLELNAAADGQYGLTVKNGATFTTYGATVTNVATKLGADVAANAASFTTAISTGWSSGDVVAIASTTRTPGDTEQITLGTVTATTCNVSVGGGTGANTVKNAHSGTGATAGEVIHLTRNVKIRNASASFGAYVDLKGTATCSCTYTEFSNLGANVSSQRGIEIETTTGSCTLSFCSIHDTRNYGLYANTATGSFTISNCCLYNMNTVNAASTASFQVISTSGTTTISGNYLLAGNASSNGVMEIQVPTGTLTNNTVAGSTSATAGFRLNAGGLIGTCSGNVVHSCSSTGFTTALPSASSQLWGTISTLTVWRNGGSGLAINGGEDRFIYNNLVAFGNTTNNVNLGTSPTLFNSPSIQGDATFATTNGLAGGTSLACQFMIINGSLGTTTAHTVDIRVDQTNQFVQGWLINTTCASATQVLVSSNASCFVHSHKDGGVATAHKSYYYRGTIAADQTIRHTASGYSWKMTPNSAFGIFPLVLPGPTFFDTFKIPVSANTPVTLSCWMYKDASYNGTAPTITIVGGVIAGVGSAGTDIVTTATLSATTWTQVTSSTVTPTEDGTIEFYISCEGTAGNLYIDDVALS